MPRIARIDEPVFRRDFGDLIVGFHQVDSLVLDEQTGEMVGIAELKRKIAEAAKSLELMGRPFSRRWRETRDILLALASPRITYDAYGILCAERGLSPIDARTLANLLHDLGYIIHYHDDERLRTDLILQPEWLTKAIGFVLEDRVTAEAHGILPDSRLKTIWYDEPLDGKTRFEPHLYPFFLRLMEKYDVSYRLEAGDASLVAQHVPQVRPPLPWLPEQAIPTGERRLAMICVMPEETPGLVPWMIVRTHAYACQNADLPTASLHWQKGMFLTYEGHGQALLELRERNFHLYVGAVYPDYFMNVLRQTLHKLITDNWPGLKGRYTFSVPCAGTMDDGQPCTGHFRINALGRFMNDGDEYVRCQICFIKQDIKQLLYGFEQEDSRAQLRRIETKLDVTRTELQRGLDGLESRLDGLDSQLDNVFWGLMRAIANEAKHGPRLYTLRQVDGGLWDSVQQYYELQLWCEADGCQHPVLEAGKGVYRFKATREWLVKVTPYLNFVSGLIKTLLPMVAPAVDSYFGSGAIKGQGLAEELALTEKVAKAALQAVAIDRGIPARANVLSEVERSGLLALHRLIDQQDPTHANLGLYRVPTRTGDYRWLCKAHYEASLSKIPDVIG